MFATNINEARIRYWYLCFSTNRCKDFIKDKKKHWKAVAMIIYQKVAEGTLLIQEEFEDTKVVIRIRISKKNRKHIGQKKKIQKAKQPSTKHTYKTKDRVTRTPLKNGGEYRGFGRVGSSCSTSDTCCVNLVTNPVISHAREHDREVLTTNGTYPTFQ